MNIENVYSVFFGDDTITGDIEVLVAGDDDNSVWIDRKSYMELKEIFEKV